MEPLMHSLNKKYERARPGWLSLDLIPDPFLVLEPDGSIYDINKPCSQLIGAGKSVLSKKNIREFQGFDRLWKKADLAVYEKKELTARMSFGVRSFEVFIMPFQIEDKILVRIIFKDITNFLKLETELLKRNRDLIIMNTLSGAFISSDNLDVVLEELLTKVLLIAEFQTGWLLLKDGDRLSLKMSRGMSPKFRQKIESDALASYCEELMTSKGEPLFVLEGDEVSKIPVLYDEKFALLVVVPLGSGGDITGLLFLASRVGRNVDFDFASLMTLIGNQVTHIIGKLKLYLETERLSVTDALTGLYNTRYFYKALENEIARTNRYDEPFSLMLFDIDNFKALNDNSGHQAGDDVLHQLALILKSISRETDAVVRYGGEEFIIILPNTPEEEAVFLANRIRSTVHDFKFLVNGTEEVKITLSGGIASYPKNAGDSKSLLNAADTALYHAKAAGKNLVFCSQETLS
jgi:diguanylate cyclase (GGDEF)-like protein